MTFPLPLEVSKNLSVLENTVVPHSQARLPGPFNVLSMLLCIAGVLVWANKKHYKWIFTFHTLRWSFICFVVNRHKSLLRITGEVCVERSIPVFSRNTSSASTSSLQLTVLFTKIPAGLCTRIELHSISPWMISDTLFIHCKVTWFGPFWATGIC